MHEVRPAPVAATTPDVQVGTDADWLDRLPVGTVVSVEALRHWRPDSMRSSRNWLLVGCIETFDFAAYQRWLTALPVTGVIVDPADARYQRFIAECTARERG